MDIENSYEERDAKTNFPQAYEIVPKCMGKHFSYES
jgi:hypothetical protein